MDKNESGWEVFEKINYRAAEMAVRFYKGGQISLTKAVHDSLGTDTVQLLYNRELKKIGIRPANENAPDTFKLRKPNKQTSWVMSAAAFLKYYNLDDLRGGKYLASSESGMIVIDVTTPMK